MIRVYIGPIELLNLPKCIWDSLVFELTLKKQKAPLLRSFDGGG